MAAPLKNWFAPSYCVCICQSSSQLKISLPDNSELLHHVSFVPRPSNPKQSHTAITKNLPGILEKLSVSSFEPLFQDLKTEAISIEWKTLPSAVDPSEGELNPGRALRKRQQIENMVAGIRRLAKPGAVVVDFCAGGGHLGLVVAYLRPDCKVILVENKEESIQRAKKRVQLLKLSNVSLYLSNLDYFSASFDVGTCLHACGSATDLVIDMCLRSRASFVVCPCCYGSIRPSTTSSYPKSDKLQSIISEEDYNIVAHASDQTSSDHDRDYSKQGKHCMGVIDSDRMYHAEQHGYQTELFIMQPRTCSPKNNVIYGHCLTR